MFFYLSLSLFSLVMAGLFGLLIALTRMPAVSLLKSPELFYHFLVGHVTFSITLWLMTFTLAYWHYREGRKGRVAPPATLLGMLLLSLSCLLPYGEPYLNNYVPVVGSPIFYLGLFLFFCGFLLEALQRLKYAKRLDELYPLSILFGILTLFSIPSSLLIAHPEGGMKLFFERLFWIPGHFQQFMYASVMLAVWHELLKKSSGSVVNSPLLKGANLLLFMSALPLLLGFFMDPLSENFRRQIALSFGVGLGVPVLLHSYHVLKNIRLSWNVATISLLFSMTVYHAGALIAYGGMQSDLRIPAHYHGVVSGVTIAFMGLTYYMLKEKLGYVFWESVAKLQPTFFGLGINLLVLGFYLAGNMGAPRKTYGFEYVQDTKVILALNVMGFGGLLAVLGGILFISYTTLSLFRGYRNVSVS